MPNPQGGQIISFYGLDNLHNAQETRSTAHLGHEYGQVNRAALEAPAAYLRSFFCLQ